jgi:hypothetical protein
MRPALSQKMPWEDPSFDKKMSALIPDEVTHHLRHLKLSPLRLFLEGYISIALTRKGFPDWLV